MHRQVAGPPSQCWRPPPPAPPCSALLFGLYHRATAWSAGPCLKAPAGEELQTHHTTVPPKCGPQIGTAVCPHGFWSR